MNQSKRVADLVVQCLEEQGVEFIFGIPGAKIDPVFDALVDSSIRLIVCRHEQNAAFMAAAYGRLTSKPGVVLVTSGPGIGNLVTGLLTATTEGDPVIAIGGNVPRNMLQKQSHQKIDNVKLMEAVTKKSVEVIAQENIPEAIANAFRVATQTRRGACFISIPQDVSQELTTVSPTKCTPPIVYGTAREETLELATRMLEQAETPLVILGEESTQPLNCSAIREFIKRHQLPVISTYQASGMIPKDLMHLFFGRIGLFKNQPGDLLLEQADTVLTIGFNPIEYDPEVWNPDSSKRIIHVDYSPCDIHLAYQPCCEILGDIARNIEALNRMMNKTFTHSEKYHHLREELLETIHEGKGKVGKEGKIHPLRFIYELSQVTDDNTIIACDIGSNYMWMARYFLSHSPHQLLFSNGQQTLGVSLPWAMAANFSYPDHHVISVSGDGGFLFSAMELETAVREKNRFIHFVWTDGSYDMVKEQEIMKYQRESGVELGPIDIISFAKAFGAHGYELTDPDQFQDLHQQALSHQGPVLINVPIDYSDNMPLFKTVHFHKGN